MALKGEDEVLEATDTLPTIHNPKPNAAFSPMAAAMEEALKTKGQGDGSTPVVEKPAPMSKQNPARPVMPIKNNQEQEKPAVAPVITEVVETAPVSQNNSAVSIVKAKHKEDIMSQDYDIFAAGVQTSTGTLASESITKLVENIEKALKPTTGGASSFKVIPVQDPTSLALPVILVGTVEDGVGHYYSVLIEEGLYRPLPTRIEQISGRPVNIFIPATRVHDADMLAVLDATATSVLGKPSQEIGYMSLATGTDLTEVRTANIVADTAKLSLKESGAGIPRPSCKSMKGNNKVVSLVTQVTPGANTMTVDGAPVTADFQATVEVRLAQQDKDRLNQAGKSATLVRVAGYVDFIKSFDPAAAMAAQYNPNPAPLKAYHPVLVLPAIEGMGVGTQKALESQGTIPAALLAIGNIYTGRNYTSVWTRATGEEKKPSIGLLAYDHNPFPNRPFIPQELKVVAGTLAAEGSYTVMDIVNSYVHDTMSVAIDVRHGARNSWFMRNLVLATRDGEVGAAANKALIREFDLFLGNDSFSKAFGDKSVVQKKTCIVHTGYYYAQNGAKRDINDYNYVKMVQMLKENSATEMRMFAESFVPGATDGAQGLVRMAETKQVLEAVAGATITGLAERVFLAPEVMSVFLACVKATELVVNSEGLYNDAMPMAFGAGFVAGQAVDHNVVGNLYSAGVPAANGTAFGGQNFVMYVPTYAQQ